MVSKKKVSRDEESYYVSVKSPSDTRRHLLESTKKSLMSLQNYHRILMIRQEKLKHLEDLKQSIKELAYLNNRLTQKLPDYNTEIMGAFKRSKHVEVKRPEGHAEKKRSEDKPKHERSDLERLEASLASIEEKLKGLE